ncbi:hypothetical protein EAS64_14260 [Trebonia kvetii]|uniref:Tyr recombinase domain-containing protein n=1 Tax=Trebonia kvetii TaxID=2480626 RepID=A0A6P2C2Q3_9ACTN|nr:hypothetical protein [Trebonia kvetii]TVZ05659.1 hypothetical protein EAS64_14260 [Trebonia kvetii]
MSVQQDGRRDGGKCEEACADPAHCLLKGTRFHDLRHFYASTLIAANVNPKVIQAPDAEDLGRGAIDAIFAATPTEQGRNRETS